MKNYLQKLSIVIGILTCNILLAQPKIKIIDPNIDFGTVNYTQEEVMKRINITNEGTDTLRISNIKADCGCTIAEITSKNIAPGDTVGIITKLFLSSLSGQVTKGISVYSNDALNSHSRISLTAYVYRRFEVIPKYLVFERVKVGKPSTAEVIIKNNTNKDAVVKSVSFNREGFVCNLNENDVLKKGEEFNLQATVIATQSGSIKSDLIIEIYHTEEKEIKVFIYGNALD